jgi:hypothetical protein
LPSVFRSREHRGLSVNHAAARRENHPLDAALARPLKQVHEADEIDVRVECGLVHRHPHVDLGGVMVQHVESPLD